MELNMVDRTTFNGASTNVPWTEFGDQYARHVKALYDASALPLTNVSGTPNDVTAQVDPVLSGVLVDGMKFTITWAAANTGAMTLRVNTSAAIPVLSADGSTMAANSTAAGTRSLIEFIGGEFRILSGTGSGEGASRYFWQFTASGTWNRPPGLHPDTPVTVELWGGGGGASGNSSSRTGGGGGGAYICRTFRYQDVPAQVPVTVGAGGGVGDRSVGGNGGSSMFGSLPPAPGGGGGGAVSGSNYYGGGGGGTSTPGQIDSSGGRIGGGGGGRKGGSSQGSDAGNLWGGGGGGVLTEAGGWGVFGGGGGGGGGDRSGVAGGDGGFSKYGGSGGAGAVVNGAAGQPGQIPGGGGGGGSHNRLGGAGARGEVRIWI